MCALSAVLTLPRTTPSSRQRRPLSTFYPSSITVTIYLIYPSMPINAEAEALKSGLRGSSQFRPTTPTSWVPSPTVLQALACGQPGLGQCSPPPSRSDASLPAPSKPDYPAFFYQCFVGSPLLRPGEIPCTKVCEARQRIVFLCSWYCKGVVNIAPPPAQDALSSSSRSSSRGCVRNPQKRPDAPWKV